VISRSRSLPGEFRSNAATKIDSSPLQGFNIAAKFSISWNSGDPAGKSTESNRFIQPHCFSVKELRISS